MKKYLFFMFIVAFSASLTAQTMPSLSSSDAVEAVSKSNPKMEKQIKDALKKDEGLQKETIGYLKKNPDTAKSVADLAKKNGGSSKGLMKSILGDKDLTAAAIDYISKNPELLSKAMKVIGM